MKYINYSEIVILQTISQTLVHKKLSLTLKIYKCLYFRYQNLDFDDYYKHCNLKSIKIANANLLLFNEVWIFFKRKKEEKDFF